MKKENDEITTLFHSRLENAELPVRQSLWATIERDIPLARQRYRSLFLQRFAGAASVLLVLAGASATYWYFTSRGDIAGVLEEAAVSPVAKGTIKTDLVSEEFPPFHAASTIAQRQGVTFSGDDNDEESAFFSFSMSISISSSETVNGGNNEGASYAGGIQQRRNNEEAVVEPAITPLEEKRQKTWALKAHASTAAPTARQSFQGLMMFTSKGNAVSLNDNTGGAISRSDFYSDTDYNNYLRILSANTGLKETRVRHKAPVSVGLSVQKKLTDRFALETGLVYTQLNSELTAGTSSRYQQNQKLHYLGIPVKADYTLYDGKKVDLYVSGGGMLEKCIAGNVKTDYYMDGEKIQSSKNTLKDNPLQVSLSASLGLLYKINERFGVYAESGLVCRFDDGSPVATVRKEKPLGINLLCGVRVTY